MTEKSGVVRSCGECTACCKTHEIESLQKPANKWCEHCVIGVKCSIYERRPKACIEYSCAWLEGKGAETERPDKTGIVVDAMISDNKEEALVRVIEVFEGRLEKPYAKRIITAFLLSGIVVYCSPIGRAGYFRSPPGAKPGPILKTIMGLLEQ